MVLARTAPSLVLLVLLAGFGPGACARGCSAGCRSGSRAAGSSRGLDNLARSIPRAQPGRYGLKPPVVAGRVGEELGYVGRAGQAGERVAVAGLDDAVGALPPIEGPASSLAKVPSPRGSMMTSREGARSFADDYARSIDSLRVTRDQHGRLLDAFDAAQALLDAVGSRDAAAVEPAAREQAERRRIEAISEVIAWRIPLVLDADQVRRLYAALGTPQVIVYRLGRERPMTRAGNADPAAP